MNMYKNENKNPPRKKKRKRNAIKIQNKNSVHGYCISQYVMEKGGEGYLSRERGPSAAHP